MVPDSALNSNEGNIVFTPNALLDDAYNDHLSGGDTPIDREQWEAENAPVLLSGRTFYMDPDTSVVDTEDGWASTQSRSLDCLVEVEFGEDGDWVEVGAASRMRL